MLLEVILLQVLAPLNIVKLASVSTLDSLQNISQPLQIIANHTFDGRSVEQHQELGLVARSEIEANALLFVAINHEMLKCGVVVREFFILFECLLALRVPRSFEEHNYESIEMAWHFKEIHDC